MIEAKTYDINVVNDIQRILDKYKVDFNYLEYLKGYLDSNIKNKCCDTTIEFLQIKAIKGIDIKFYNDDTITYSRSPIELHDGNIYIVNLPISLDDAFENKAENYIRIFLNPTIKMKTAYINSISEFEDAMNVLVTIMNEYYDFFYNPNVIGLIKKLKDIDKKFDEVRAGYKRQIDAVGKECEKHFTIMKMDMTPDDVIKRLEQSLLEIRNNC